MLASDVRLEWVNVRIIKYNSLIYAWVHVCFTHLEIVGAGLCEAFDLLGITGTEDALWGLGADYPHPPSLSICACVSACHDVHYIPWDCWCWPVWDIWPTRNHWHRGSSLRVRCWRCHIAYWTWWWLSWGSSSWCTTSWCRSEKKGKQNVVD